MPMEIKREKEELNACNNTVTKKGENEEIKSKKIKSLVSVQLVNVQTQTEKTDNDGGIETKRYANECKGDYSSNSSEKPDEYGKVALNGFNHQQCSPKRVGNFRIDQNKPK